MSRYERIDYPFEGIIIGLSAGSIVNSVMSVLIWEATDSTPYFSLSISAAFFLAALGLAVYRRNIKFWKSIDPNDEGHKFCVSCGKRLVVFEAQTGFDTKTGKPTTAMSLACPNLSSVYLSGYRDSNIFCEMRIDSTAKPAKHICDGNPSTDCHGCLNDMLTNDIIDQPTFDKLIKAA